MSMNAFLAEFYGTNKTASAPVDEDLQKEATIDLFMKLAEQSNIDLASMSEPQVQSLYDNWLQKAAAEGGPGGDHHDDDDEEAEKKKKRMAAEEHEEKKASVEKWAEADQMGRIMAHAYVQELQKIAAAQGGEEQEKEAAMPAALRKGIDAVKGTSGKATAFVKEKGKAGWEATKGGAGKSVEFAKEKGKAVGNHMSENRGKYIAGAGAAGTAGGAAAGYQFGKKKKEASAIDELAAEQAVYMAANAGFDPEEAGRKVASVLELQLLGESEKVAFAPDADTAVQTRALEFLETAGYPVTWNE